MLAAPGSAAAQLLWFVYEDQECSRGVEAQRAAEGLLNCDCMASLIEHGKCTFKGQSGFGECNTSGQTTTCQIRELESATQLLAG